MKKIAIDCRLIGKEISGIAKFLLMILKGLKEIPDLPYEICLIVREYGPEVQTMQSLFGDIPFPILTVKTDPFTVKDQFLLPDTCSFHFRRIGPGRK